MVDKWLRDELEIAPASHYMTCDQISTAFDLLHAGQSIRSVIHFQSRETMQPGGLAGKIVSSK
ncbi:hypothetical protein ACGK9R_15090 [Halomonas sp. HNIBRBA4712]|uniref:hypothetical protein n=1 Tax=Halomonas sp. HNIBRBA4712 TaxID=3373087 RepID=UPI0037473821